MDWFWIAYLSGILAAAIATGHILYRITTSIEHSRTSSLIFAGSCTYTLVVLLLAIRWADSENSSERYTQLGSAISGGALPALLVGAFVCGILAHRSGKSIPD